VWDSATREGLATLRGQGQLFSAAFDREGWRPALGGEDGAVLVADGAAGLDVAQANGHRTQHRALVMTQGYISKALALKPVALKVYVSPILSGAGQVRRCIEGTGRGFPAPWSRCWSQETRLPV